jgi:hypothetical protein
VVTGLDNEIFDELGKAMDMSPKLNFPAFNKNSLKRIIEDEDVKE